MWHGDKDCVRLLKGESNVVKHLCYCLLLVYVKVMCHLDGIEGDQCSYSLNVGFGSMYYQ